eukprot:TRINITY_DN782088_c0_g1_i1.p1 TRINITY_DN782088_c0_g1~~TRINITY_DN782088_c0_g1_i1.p1  ORF type:complete len:323 (+),score=93.86 TRINITY_DN782088_c0_g1_i1:747-1715(+)
MDKEVKKARKLFVQSIGACFYGRDEDLAEFKIVFGNFKKNITSGVEFLPDFFRLITDTNKEWIYPQLKAILPSRKVEELAEAEIQLEKLKELEAESKEKELEIEKQMRIKEYNKQVTIEKAKEIIKREQKRDPSTPYFNCAKCRCLLFFADEIAVHDMNKHNFAYRKGTQKDDCSSFFFNEALEWMKLESTQGKIVCPKCSGRLGSYNWSGSQCSCGTWICPGIQVTKSRVDMHAGKAIKMLSATLDEGLLKKLHITANSTGESIKEDIVEEEKEEGEKDQAKGDEEIVTETETATTTEIITTTSTTTIKETSEEINELETV